jgi:predicted SAM-dependent methyltransferase
MRGSVLGGFARARTTEGVRRALRELADEWRIQRRHRASLKRADRYAGVDLKLNAGCGPKAKSGWVNIDLSEAADLQLDLREALPFADGSAAIVYSEHFFEHLEYPDEALSFLRESLRVLRPGGMFRLGVPDGESMLRDYIHGSEETFRLIQKQWHPAWCNTRMHSVNYFFRQGREHKYAYDYETLARILGEVGFVSIARRPFDPAFDSEEREQGTLYINAYKP